MRLILTILTLCLIGCGGTSTTETTRSDKTTSNTTTSEQIQSKVESNVLPPAPKLGEVLSVADAQKRVTAIQQQIASYKLLLATATADLQAAKDNELSIRCVWAATIFALAAAACFVAAYFLPILKMRLAYAGAALGILSATAWYLSDHVWIVNAIGFTVVGGGLSAICICGVVLAIREIKKGHAGILAATNYAEDLEKLIKDNIHSIGTGNVAEVTATMLHGITSAKLTTAVEQANTKVHTLIDDIRTLG